MTEWAGWSFADKNFWVTVSGNQGRSDFTRGSGVVACTVHPIGTETEFAEVAARESPGVGGGAVGPQQTAEQVARAIVGCARNPRPEVFPHGLSRVLVWLNAIAPSLVDWYAYRAATKSGRL